MGYTIGQLAQQAGVGVETVRYYQSLGLLDVPNKPLGGQRRYEDAHLRQLRLIRRAQTCGLSLADVGILVGRDSSCQTICGVIARRLGDDRSQAFRISDNESRVAWPSESMFQCSS
ncbi:MerR family transcriptional regulator [Cupriavidus necator]